MAGSHRTVVGILDMSQHFWRWAKNCRDLICFIKIDTSCIYRGQFLAPYDTFRHLSTPFDTFRHLSTPLTTVITYVPYRVTFQTVHPKRHMDAKYSHGCLVWTRHNPLTNNCHGLIHICVLDLAECGERVTTKFHVPWCTSEIYT